MNTLFLHPQSWDLTLEIEGNIAMAKDSYAKAQDVASAVKLFRSELYYQTEKGLPYFDETLGRKQSLSLYRYRLEQAALTVPDVVSAKAVVQTEGSRVLGGSILITDIHGKSLTVNL